MSDTTATDHVQARILLEAFMCGVESWRPMIGGMAAGLAAVLITPDCPEAEVQALRESAVVACLHLFDHGLLGMRAAVEAALTAPPVPTAPLPGDQ